MVSAFTRTEFIIGCLDCERMIHASRGLQPSVNANPVSTTLYCTRPLHNRPSQRSQRAHCVANCVQQSLACVREAKTDDELETCARIRASAFYEELPTPRYVINLKRQFARDEFQALVKRTRNLPGSGSPKALCMVALDADGEVVGSVDLRPPFSKTGRQPDGVPEDVNAAFLVNLAVHTRSRKKGFGSALLREALVTARQQLEAHRVYAHADATNPASCALYERAGFERCSCPDGTALQSGICILVAEFEQPM